MPFWASLGSKKWTQNRWFFTSFFVEIAILAETSLKNRPPRSSLDFCNFTVFFFEIELSPTRELHFLKLQFQKTHFFLNWFCLNWLLAYTRSRFLRSQQVKKNCVFFSLIFENVHFSMVFWWFSRQEASLEALLEGPRASWEHTSASMAHKGLPKLSSWGLQGVPPGPLGGFGSSCECQNEFRRGICARLYFHGFSSPHWYSLTWTEYVR